MTPNPGSEEAIHLGCTCPVLDNAHGRGYLGKSDVFVFTCDRPVHRQDSTEGDQHRDALLMLTESEAVAIPSHIVNDPAFQAYRRAQQAATVLPMPGRSNILPFRRVSR